MVGIVLFMCLPWSSIAFSILPEFVPSPKSWSPQDCWSCGGNGRDFEPRPPCV